MVGLNKTLLQIDIETFSSADISKTGVFKYVEAPDFEILLMSYAVGDDPVSVWDFTQDGPPPWLPGLLTDPDVVKVAHNCQFERACLNRTFGLYSPPEQWVDTMHLAAMNGLPMTLEAVGAALQLEQQKLDTGKALIRYFCKPCAPTKANGGRTRNLPEHAPEKWEQFKAYCLRDTEAEREILNRLTGTKVTPTERRVECLDARINERGIAIDLTFAGKAVEMDDAFKAEHGEEMRRLTGLENPNSVAQLKAWLALRGLTTVSLDKKALTDLLDKVTDPTTKRVLTLRQMLGKSSTSKYTAMQTAACADGRVRGTLQYYGAGRTGRWAGRIVQPQNFPQNHLDQIDKVRDIVRSGDLEGLELIYDNIPDVLSQLIRTAIVAKEGHTFLVADYSAIEARVINYLAGEKWANEAFAAGEDIYCKTASMTFGVPVVKHGINGHLRQRGKVMVLGLGYGMGVDRFIEYAEGYGVTFDRDEAKRIVDQWRRTSPTIPKLWRDVEVAAKRSLSIWGAGKTYKVPCGVSFRRDANAMRCTLPSGRVLSYWGAEIEDGTITFMGQNQTTRKWEKTSTWGGKLTENIVQAYARDCMAVAMLRLEEAGYQIVFTVHDEVIVEAPEGRRWQDVADIMGQPIDWAPGLILRGDGYSTKFYKKD